MQTFVEDGFTFRLYADVLGTSRMGHVGDVTVDVTAGPAERLVAVGPRLVREGATAPLRLHLEDRWGNVVSDAPTRISVDPRPEASAFGAAIRPETQTLDLPSAGLLRRPPRPLRRHGRRAGHRLQPRYARRVGGLDALGYTANDFQITAAAWDEVVRRCRAAEEEGAFVVYPGVEWCGNASVGGDHNVVFLGEDTTLARSLEWHDSMSAGIPAPQHWPITEL